MHSTRAAIARVLLITVYGLGIALCLPIPGPIGRTTFATVSAIPFGTVTTVSETAVQAAFVAAVLISIFGAGAWVIVGRTVLPRLFARAAAARTSFHDFKSTRLRRVQQLSSRSKGPHPQLSPSFPRQPLGSAVAPCLSRRAAPLCGLEGHLLPCHLHLGGHAGVPAGAAESIGTS
ncbi:hypothetical protein BC834DRAFT_170368 [Gloeopeniophorella convolvens]|nr:hypothetical protein BC834DRAFT_170368 [Gloeopeniophorella convolvens]